MPKFKPGQSGNPAGKPKSDAKSAIVRRIQKKFGKDAKHLVAALEAIAQDPEANKRERLGAIRELLDRGWGKPLQTAQVEMKVPEPMFTVARMPSLDKLVVPEIAAVPQQAEQTTKPERTVSKMN